MKEEEFIYTVTAEDYLTHQLFSASSNAVFKKQRKKGLIIWTFFFLILALVFYIQKNIHLAIYFILFGIIFICIYPIYSRWIYKQYYKKIVKRNFNKDKEVLKLKLKPNALVLSNQEEEGVIPLDNIDKIYEISTHVFIRLKDGKNIIVSKIKLNNKDAFLEKIPSLVNQNSAYVKLLNWKWK